MWKIHTIRYNYTWINHCWRTLLGISKVVLLIYLRGTYKAAACTDARLNKGRQMVDLSRASSTPALCMVFGKTFSGLLNLWHGRPQHSMCFFLLFFHHKLVWTMKGASWAAGTISTAPDVEVCNSQQQAREKNEKKDRMPCHFQPVGVHRTSRTHARAKMRRHVDADLSLSLDSSVGH